MSRLFNLSLAAIAVALAPMTLRTFEVTESPTVEPDAVEVVTPEAEEVLEDGLLAANWTFVGCIFLNGSCKDAFIDEAGAYWVCKACGTTGNPSPGKCRKLTRYELEHALWCS